MGGGGIKRRVGGGARGRRKSNEEMKTRAHIQLRLGFTHTHTQIPLTHRSHTHRSHTHTLRPSLMYCLLYSLLLHEWNDLIIYLAYSHALRSSIV